MKNAAENFVLQIQPAVSKATSRQNLAKLLHDAALPLLKEAVLSEQNTSENLTFLLRPILAKNGINPDGGLGQFVLSCVTDEFLLNPAPRKGTTPTLKTLNPHVWWSSVGTGVLRGDPSTTELIGGLQANYAILAAGGDTVYIKQFDDMTGRNRPLVQTGTSAQPQFGLNTINGFKVATFDGVNDSMSRALGGASTPWTHVMVGQLLTKTGGVTDEFWRSAGSMVVAGSGPTIRVSSGTGVSLVGPNANLDLHIYIFEGNGANSFLYYEDTVVVSGNAGSGSTLGTINYGSGSVPANFNLCEHLVFTRILAEYERLFLVQTLRSRWGL